MAKKATEPVFERWADGTPRTDYQWHHQNSRRFTCRCGELYTLWPEPAGYEHKSRIRCSCGVLHVRHAEFQ